MEISGGSVIMDRRPLFWKSDDHAPDKDLWNGGAWIFIAVVVIAQELDD